LWPKADLNFGDFGYMKASALEKSGHWVHESVRFREKRTLS